jgi:hypothetical protein
MIEIVVTNGLITAAILYLWFYTDFFVRYMRLLGLGFLWVNKYDAWREEEVEFKGGSCNSCKNKAVEQSPEDVLAGAKPKEVKMHKPKQNRPFVDYLSEKEGFFSKLFSCPNCFGFWVSILSACFVMDLPFATIDRLAIKGTIASALGGYPVGLLLYSLFDKWNRESRAANGLNQAISQAAQQIAGALRPQQMPPQQAPK